MHHTPTTIDHSVSPAPTRADRSLTTTNRWTRRPALPALVLPLLLLASAHASPPSQPHTGSAGPSHTPLIVEARITAVSSIPSLDDIRPYRDALVVHEAQVEKVTAGQLDAQRIRIALWAIHDGQPQPSAALNVGDRLNVHLRPLSSLGRLDGAPRRDDLPLDLDAPVFLDLDQSLQLPPRSQHDYGDGQITQQFALLHALRSQVRIVIWGDSRVHEGVNAGAFQPQTNTITPTALNLAVPSAGLAYLGILTEQYLPHLDNLDWVVIGLAPRMVNLAFNTHPAAELLASDAYRDDLANDFARWRQPTNAPLTVNQLRKMPGLAWRELPWGTPRGRTNVAKVDVDAGFIARASRTRWRFSVHRWLLLKAAVERLNQQGVRVLIFTPPVHPAFAQTPAVDEDGTPRGAYEDLVARLAAFASTRPGVIFVDINRGARHDFGPELFADLDHLNREGAERLSQMLERLRAQHEADAPEFQPAADAQRPQAASTSADTSSSDAPPPWITNTRSGLEWTRLELGRRLYVDRGYTIDAAPDALLGLPLLMTRNSDRYRDDDDLISFTLKQPARVWIALAPRGDDAPDWLLDYTYDFRTITTRGEQRRLYYRDMPAGAVQLPGPGRTSREMYSLIIQPRPTDQPSQAGPTSTDEKADQG